METDEEKINATNDVINNNNNNDDIDYSNIHVFYNNLPSNYNKDSCINNAKDKKDHILYLMDCIRVDIKKVTNIINNDEKKEKEFNCLMKSIEIKIIKLNNELHYLDSKKYCGLSIKQLSTMVLDILSYACAVKLNNNTSNNDNDKWLFPNVGKLITYSKENYFDNEELNKYENIKIEDAGYVFVFNVRIRTALLSIACTLVIEIGSFYTTTNKSFHQLPSSSLSSQKEGEEQHKNNSYPRLILNWKILYKLLLLTFPYLDNTTNEYACSSFLSVPNCAFSRIYSMNHYTINFIIQCSNFYIQENDQTSMEVWDLIKNDIYMNHSCISSRAALMLYIFLPSKCSSEYYTTMLPIWFDVWKNTDRNMSWDGIWVHIFCRARKYLPYANFNWNIILQHLLTYCLSWLNIPVGGKSGASDSFPSPAGIKTKSFNRLFTSLLDFDLPSSSNQSSSSSGKESEFSNFIRKLCKIIFYVLTNEPSHQVEGGESSLKDVIQFLSFLSPYFNASNHGYWTYPLGIFLQQFCYEFVRSIGTEYGLDYMQQLQNKDLYNTLIKNEPYLQNTKWDKKDVVILLDALLPLCQNAICSKNGNVAVASVHSLLSLIEIDPYNISHTFLDFSVIALQSVTLSHQVPSVLSLLSRIIQPLLRKYPTILLKDGRLLDFMNLALAGLDCNDKDKTYKTFKFYKTVLSWIPIGDIRSLNYNLIDDTILQRNSDSTTSGATATFKRTDGIIHLGTNIIQTTSNICNDSEYKHAINAISDDSSLLTKTSDGDTTTTKEEIQTYLEETCMTLSDWSLEVLDRIFLLFHSTGPREKILKHSVRANRMTHRDMKKGLTESIIFYEFCEQYVSSLCSKSDRKLVSKIVLRFLIEDVCCIHAVKNIALLCRALCYVRNNDDCKESILHDIVPKLCHDLSSKSSTTIQYYVRCISGCVRNSGIAVLSHKDIILHSLDYTLAMEDKKCFKSGCKLLRHLLLNVCQCYPYLDEFCPVKKDGNKSSVLGKSAQFFGSQKIQWHVPTGEEIDFAVLLLDRYVVQPMRNFCMEEEILKDGHSGNGNSAAAKANQKVMRLRKLLKVIRYALRGCTSILLDIDVPFDAQNSTPKVDLEMMDLSINDDDDDDDDSNDEEFDDLACNKIHPHEEAMRTIIQNSSNESQKLLHILRPTLCDFVIKMMSFIASTYYEWKENPQQEQNNINIGHMIGDDFKISRELIQISTLLLKSRYHSSSNYSSGSKKQISFNKVLSRQAHILENAYTKYGSLDNSAILHRDGEDGGKIISQRTHVLICMKFYENIASSASMDVPKKLWMEYKQKYPCKKIPLNLFDDEFQKCLDHNSDEIDTEDNKTLLMDRSNTKQHHPISYYAALIDGLFALSYHHKTDVRKEAIRSIGHSVDRYGFIVIKRLLRLVKTFSFNDQLGQKNNRVLVQYGIPCINGLIQKIIDVTALSESKDSKHVSTLKMRLSEICISLCSFISYPRCMKALYSSQELQMQFLQIFHKSEYLVKFLPDDATQKMIMSYQRIFLVYRSQWYSNDMNNLFEKGTANHKKTVDFLMDLLCDGWDGSNVINSNELLNAEGEATHPTSDEKYYSNTMAHWRNRLLMGWFLTTYVQKDDLHDLVSSSLPPALNIWTLCCHLIVNESGQPMQRLALGLFGRIITLLNSSYNLSLVAKPENEADFSKLLHEKFSDKKFSRAFIQALVFDHREDRQITGNTPAQWTAGVEDILHDATKNLAPSILFPFVNVGRNSITFKVQHAQMIQSLFTCIGYQKVFVVEENRSMLHMFLKDMALTELANAAPSEDQKNCRCTSAEIFAGIGRFLLLTSPDATSRQDAWYQELLPFLEKVITIIPMDIVAAFCDSMRFIIQRLPPSYFYHLTSWLMLKVEKTLWQYNSGQDSDESEATNDGSMDRFSLQTKWLSLLNYVLTEISWDYPDNIFDLDDFKLTWIECICGRLLPRLLNAMGHPYDQCRNTISSTLLRICQCQRKLEALQFLSKEASPEKYSRSSKQNPGEVILEFMLSKPFHEDHIRVHFQFLLTIRSFIFHCIQSGDCIYECLKYIYPLLTLAFDFSVFDDSEVNPSDENIGNKDTLNGANEAATTSNRILEAEVSKAFRFALATVASSCLMTHFLHEDDINQVLDIVNGVISKENQKWQIRQVAVNFLRCFQGSHRIIFSTCQTSKVLDIVINMLADDRREVSSAAQTAVTGIIAGAPIDTVSELVQKFIVMAKKSLPSKKRRKKIQQISTAPSTSLASTNEEKEKIRRRQQQTSVLFLSACVLARPYDTPSYVPSALEALSKHSFDATSAYVVREAVKHCCSEYKKTHMSENWEMHRIKFSREELESLQDVVSTPHYYA